MNRILFISYFWTYRPSCAYVHVQLLHIFACATVRSMIPINYSIGHILCFRCLLELLQREDGQWLDTQWLLNQPFLSEHRMKFDGPSKIIRIGTEWQFLVHESCDGSFFFGFWQQWWWKQKCLTMTYGMQKQVISHVLVTFLPYHLR